jgi:TolA-binding protein
MKAGILILAASLLMASIAAAQNAPQTPPPGNQTGSGSGSADSTMKPGTVHSQRHESSGEHAGGMQAQHMQEMRQGVAKMQALLDQMKANVAGMTGKDKAAMQANVELWQMMIDHMKQMSEHMSGMGMMDRHEGTMHHMGGMHHEAPAPPPGAPAAPKSSNPTTPPEH